MTETDAYAFIKDLIESGSLEGNEVSKIVSVAFFALSGEYFRRLIEQLPLTPPVYEYLITMDQEVGISVCVRGVRVLNRTPR